MLLLALLLLAAGLSPAAEPFLEKVNLFEAQTGGYEHYRIPAIVVTGKGSVLAFTEARKNPGGDWGPIDILMRRSTDGGRTWDAPRKVAHVDGPIQQNAVALEQGLAKPGEVTYNNVVPIVDRETGAIHLLFCVEYARAYSMRSDDDGRTFSKPVDITPEQKRYGISAKDWGYGWARVDDRFDVAKHPNEPHRAGYVVEIDPTDPTSTPKKRSG